MNKHDVTYHYQKELSARSKVVQTVRRFFYLFYNVSVNFFSNITKEWIHQFSGHEDIIHSHGEDGEE